MFGNLNFKHELIFPILSICPAQHSLLGSTILITLSDMKIMVFWDTIQSSLVYRYQWYQCLS
jgi:hypothetical protein